MKYATFVIKDVQERFFEHNQFYSKIKEKVIFTSFWILVITYNFKKIELIDFVKFCNLIFMGPEMLHSLKIQTVTFTHF